VDEERKRQAVMNEEVELRRKEKERERQQILLQQQEKEKHQTAGGNGPASKRAPLIGAASPDDTTNMDPQAETDASGEPEIQMSTWYTFLNDCALLNLNGMRDTKVLARPKNAAPSKKPTMLRRRRSIRAVTMTRLAGKNSGTKVTNKAAAFSLVGEDGLLQTHDAGVGLSLQGARLAFTAAQSGMDNTGTELSCLAFPEFVEALGRVAVIKWNEQAFHSRKKLDFALRVSKHYGMIWRRASVHPNRQQVQRTQPPRRANISW